MADIAVIESKVIRLEKDTTEQWDAINELRRFMRKLVPVWVTVAFSTLTFLTGSALTIAVMVIRFAGK